jgi:hypothetical protein
MAQLAQRELESTAIIDQPDVVDCKVVRLPKTYPPTSAPIIRTLRPGPVVSGWFLQPGSHPAQRHAQVQQFGSLHADRNDRCRQHLGGSNRQIKYPVQLTPRRSITKKKTNMARLHRRRRLVRDAAQPGDRGAFRLQAKPACWNCGHGETIPLIHCCGLITVIDVGLGKRFIWRGCGPTDYD